MIEKETDEVRRDGDMRENKMRYEMKDEMKYDNKDGAWIAFDNTVRSQSEVFFNDTIMPVFTSLWERESYIAQYGMQLSIGSASSGAPMHGHDSAWCVLLTGRKRWFLMPPNGMGLRNRFWAEPKHPRSQLSLFKKLREEGLLFETTQYPGDVLYVPSDWVHGTLNTCETVALAQEFGIGLPWQPPQPVALDMYGVK
eukprot:CAMPEP_0182436580 /NCGR_PEP_ID=MMETSP1167-20130531/82355_1 /TAXON_ID=2988 /ORGANISM="Mallomonas Sp, Strain CCMP3275" /LENGTH=196 /DNA_ID=CAMNT_0024628903 /DNA_START=123 /DNA_END=713 /DNA_ORIENTATION=-